MSKALDPVEKAKRQLSLAQLSFQTKALQDYKSGKLSADDFDLRTGLPLTAMEKLQRDHMKLIMESQRKTLEYNDKVRNSTFGGYYQVPQQQRNDSLPPGGPVMPDELPGASTIDSLPNEIQPERFR